MRKQILDMKTPETPSAEPVWLDLERLARVELSSEEAAHPVELYGVGALELQIVPDIIRGPACATLEQFRLA